MATYSDLKTLESDSVLQTKVEVALWVAAEAIQNEDPATANHANRLKWAKQVLRDPAGSKDDFLRYLLAANDDQSLATIQAASDATVQTHVNNAVNVFADGSGS